MKLIVIEGIDGSGKETQAKLLADALGAPKISFPNYNSPSSSLVKMYLNGELGGDAIGISPYAASSFYAIDRFAFFQQNKEILNSEYVVADRYTTSNIIHQSSKLAEDEKNEYLNWLENYEYNLLEIPKPAKVIFLDVSPDTSRKLALEREKKFDGKDIHENDFEYMKKCYDTAKWAAEKCNWEVIRCEENENLLSIHEIHKKVLGRVF